MIEVRDTRASNNAEAVPAAGEVPKTCTGIIEGWDWVTENLP